MPGGTAADATDTATLSTVCAALSAAGGLTDTSACTVLSVTETLTGWSYSFDTRAVRRQLAAPTGPAMPSGTDATWRWLAAINASAAGVAPSTVLQALGRPEAASMALSPLAESWARVTGQDASAVRTALALDGVSETAPPHYSGSSGSGGTGGGSNTVAIGAGVGGGVAGVLVIASLVAWLVMRRKSSRARGGGGATASQKPTSQAANADGTSSDDVPGVSSSGAAGSRVEAV